MQFKLEALINRINQSLSRSVLLGLSFAIAVICQQELPAQTHDEKPIELSGFSVSEAFEIADGKPLDLADSMLVKLLYRISNTSDNTLDDYLHYTSQLNWQQITTDTLDYRLRVFGRSGRVKKITTRRIPGATNDDPIKGGYLADCVTAQGQPFQVMTLTTPRLLKLDQPIDEPIEFLGFLFAMIAPDNGGDPVAETSAEQESAGDTQKTDSNQQAELDTEAEPPNVPLFLARRLAWFPELAEPENGITQWHVLLARHGVDIGQFDFVRQQNSKPLGIADGKCFYQMLDAVNTIPPDQVNRTQLGFSQLMRQPTENFGNAVSLRARVKKCSPIKITNPQTEAQLGSKLYYQLMVFPDLDGQQIVVKNPTGEDLEYSRFPVTLCVRSLPDGMSHNDIENKQIQIEGFYFRFWRYPSERTDQAGSAGQVSPLIIAKQPHLVASDEETFNFILGIFMLVIGVLLAGMIWFFRNSKSGRQATDSSASIEGLPEKIDLTGIEEF